MSEKADDIFARLSKISSDKLIKESSSSTTDSTAINTRSKVNHKEIINNQVNNHTVTRPDRPDSTDDFDKQLSLVKEGIMSRLKSGNKTSALKFSLDWIDGITDNDDNMYEEVRNGLMTLDKSDLVNYIEVLVSALK